MMHCRVCYAKSLTPDERDRFYAEPVTTVVYYCPEHQAALDRLHEGWAKFAAGGIIQRMSDPYRDTQFPEFPRVED